MRPAIGQDVVLRKSFEAARQGFYQACDADNQGDVRLYARQAWEAGNAMAESGLFHVSELIMLNDTLESISAIATLTCTTREELQRKYQHIGNNDFNG